MKDTGSNHGYNKAKNRAKKAKFYSKQLEEV